MRRSRSLFLALAALFAAVMNPPGYMTFASATDSVGDIVISICTGRGADRAVILRDDPRYDAYAAIYGESDENSHGTGGEVREGCSFAGTDTHALTPTDTDLPSGLAAPVARHSRLAALSVRTPRASPPSTGPPVTT